MTLAAAQFVLYRRSLVASGYVKASSSQSRRRFRKGDSTDTSDPSPRHEPRYASSASGRCRVLRSSADRHGGRARDAPPRRSAAQPKPPAAHRSHRPRPAAPAPSGRRSTTPAPPPPETPLGRSRASSSDERGGCADRPPGPEGGSPNRPPRRSDGRSPPPRHGPSRRCSAVIAAGSAISILRAVRESFRRSAASAAFHSSSRVQARLADIGPPRSGMTIPVATTP